MADGVGQFGGCQIRSAAEIAAGDGGDGFSALGGVYFRAGGGEGNGRGLGADRYGCAGGMQLRCGGGGGFGGLGLGGEVRTKSERRRAIRRLAKKIHEIPVMI